MVQDTGNDKNLKQPVRAVAPGGLVLSGLRTNGIKRVQRADRQAGRQADRQADSSSNRQTEGKRRRTGAGRGSCGVFSLGGGHRLGGEGGKC